MEYAGFRNGNPNNKKILHVVKSEDVSRSETKGDLFNYLDNRETPYEIEKRPVVLDLGESAIRLISKNDEQDPLIVRVAVKTSDDKYMINKNCTSEFNETIATDVEVACDKKIISLPVEVKGNVTDELQTIGICEGDIESMSLELLEADISLSVNSKKNIVDKLQSIGIDEAKISSMTLESIKEITDILTEVLGSAVNGNLKTGISREKMKSMPLNLLESDHNDEFYLAEVHTKLTKDEIISRLGDDADSNSKLKANDFIFKESHVEINDNAKKVDLVKSESKSKDISEPKKLFPKISKYIKKVCHIT